MTQEVYEIAENLVIASIIEVYRLAAAEMSVPGYQGQRPCLLRQAADHWEIVHPKAF